MSLINIAQDAARYAGTSVPATIVGNSDEEAVRLLALAKTEVEMLSRRHNWTVLQREHTFSTSASDSDYDLPSDFGWLIHNTAWNRSETDPLSGPISNQTWQEWQSGILQPVVNDNWRIFPTNGTSQFYIEPTPTATETIAFEYMSRNFVVTAGGDEVENYQADTDSSRVSEHLVKLGLIWRLLNRMGFQFVTEKSEYEEQVSIAIARDGGNKKLRLGGRRVNPKTAAYTPEAGYG